MRKIGIVGLSLSTHDQAPGLLDLLSGGIGDPSWELWGLPFDRGFWLHYDRLFEMHDRPLLEKPEAKRDKDYWEKLQNHWNPIYMQQHWPDIPQSVAFPLEELLETVFYNFPRRNWIKNPQEDWYNSSIAYMIALAIHELDHEGVIGLWGIDVRREDEFQYEKPCLDYLIGYANGRGIDVDLPEGPTQLCIFEGEGIKLGDMMPSYPRRYGYLT